MGVTKSQANNSSLRRNLLIEDLFAAISTYFYPEGIDKGCHYTNFYWAYGKAAKAGPHVSPPCRNSPLGDLCGETLPCSLQLFVCNFLRFHNHSIDVFAIKESALQDG